MPIFSAKKSKRLQTLPPHKVYNRNFKEGILFPIPERVAGWYASELIYGISFYTKNQKIYSYI